LRWRSIHSRWRCSRKLIIHNFTQRTKWLKNFSHRCDVIHHVVRVWIQSLNLVLLNFFSLATKLFKNHNLFIKYRSRFGLHLSALHNQSMLLRVVSFMPKLICFNRTLPIFFYLLYLLSIISKCNMIRYMQRSIRFCCCNPVLFFCYFPSVKKALRCIVL